jgi:hypothetical protein
MRSSRLLSISLHGPLRHPWPSKTLNCFCLAPLVALGKMNEGQFNHIKGYRWSKNMRPSGQRACFVFRRSQVHTSASRPVILNQAFRAFPPGKYWNLKRGHWQNVSGKFKFWAIMIRSGAVRTLSWYRDLPPSTVSTGGKVAGAWSSPLASKSRMVELYFHSTIHLHGIVIN